MYESFLKLAAKSLVEGNAGPNKQTKHVYASFVKLAAKSLLGNAGQN